MGRSKRGQDLEARVTKRSNMDKPVMGVARQLVSQDLVDILERGAERGYPGSRLTSPDEPTSHVFRVGTKLLRRIYAAADQDNVAAYQLSGTKNCGEISHAHPQSIART